MKKQNNLSHFSPFDILLLGPQQREATTNRKDESEKKYE